MDISKNIISIRESKGIKQYEVAEKLGIEPPNYSRLEKRGDKLTIEQLKKIADALGVVYLDFFGLDSKSTKDSTDYLKRIEELEDRIKDKNIIISQNISLIKNIETRLATNIQILISCIAEQHNLVNVELTSPKGNILVESKDYIKGMLKEEYLMARYFIDKSRVDELIDVCINEYGLDLFAELMSDIRNEDFDTYPLLFIKESIEKADSNVWVPNM